MRISMFLTVLILAGCASQPQSPAAPATVAAPAAAAAPAQVAQAEPGAYKPPSGFRAKKLGSSTVYCKKDTVLGSRFPTEFCFSEDELKDIERTNSDMRQNKLKTQGVCGSGTMACGNSGG